MRLGMGIIIGIMGDISAPAAALAGQNSLHRVLVHAVCGFLFIFFLERVDSEWRSR